jgi:hypothetical protein
MELVTEPDLYCPSIDELGNYVDKIPSFHIIKKGVLCPCGSRKDKTYDSSSTFSQHTKTKMHQKWLQQLNLNKANYYVENERLKETIQTQRLIIAKMEKDLANKLLTVDYLTQQLYNSNLSKNTKNNKSCQNKSMEVTNLLDFD